MIGSSSEHAIWALKNLVFPSEMVGEGGVSPPPTPCDLKFDYERAHYNESLGCMDSKTVRFDLVFTNGLHIKGTLDQIENMIEWPAQQR